MNDAHKVMQAEYLQGIGRGEALPDGCDTASFSKSGWISAKGEGWELTDAGREHLGTLSPDRSDEGGSPPVEATASTSDAAASVDAVVASDAVQLL